MLVEVDKGELLEHHLEQAAVLHLEAAPEGVHALGAQVQRVFREKGRLAGTGTT
jgi:hypothetical protein